jgi:hypothetical protein
MVVSTLALSMAACGGGSEEQPPPQTADGYQAAQPAGPYGPQPYGSAQPQPGGQPSAQQPAQAPPPAAGTQQPPPGQVPTLGSVMADPNALQNIIAGALSAGAASLGAVTGGELGPVEQGIKMQAPQQAKGMTADGQLMHAKLSPGGHAEGSATLQPGACYTVIGFGGPGVFDYQLNLITAPPMPPQVLAQSAAGGVAPVIGPNDQCIKNPYPLPLVVKVDMHVLRGQGTVGAQVYKK